MANGKNMLSDFDFEKKIENFNPAERFLARQIWEIRKQCPACNPPPRKRQYVAYGAGTGGGVVIVYAVIELLLRIA